MARPEPSLRQLSNLLRTVVIYSILHHLDAHPLATTFCFLKSPTLCSLLVSDSVQLALPTSYRTTLQSTIIAQLPRRPPLSFSPTTTNILGSIGAASVISSPVASTICSLLALRQVFAPNQVPQRGQHGLQQWYSAALTLPHTTPLTSLETTSTTPPTSHHIASIFSTIFPPHHTHLHLLTHFYVCTKRVASCFISRTPLSSLPALQLTRLDLLLESIGLICTNLRTPNSYFSLYSHLITTAHTQILHSHSSTHIHYTHTPFTSQSAPYTFPCTHSPLASNPPPAKPSSSHNPSYTNLTSTSTQSMQIYYPSHTNLTIHTQQACKYSHKNTIQQPHQTKTP